MVSVAKSYRLYSKHGTVGALGAAPRRGLSSLYLGVGALSEGLAAWPRGSSAAGWSWKSNSWLPAPGCWSFSLGEANALSS